MTERPDQTTVPPLLGEHTLDAELRLLGGSQASVQQRLEVIWRGYEAAHGLTISRPPTQPDRHAVLSWIRGMRGTDDFPMFRVKELAMTSHLHATVGEKASNITQMGCRVHRPFAAVGQPAAVNFPIDVDPWSAQSRSTKVAIREAVQEELRARNIHSSPWGTSPLCLTVTAIVARQSRRKDVDNLVKGLLDALVHHLYEDDDQIQCLTVRRLEYAGSHGYYLVHAIPVLEPDYDVIFDDPEPPRILVGRRVEPPK